jgi:hypothetical protein
MAGARQMVGPQLVAHDEENVADHFRDQVSGIRYQVSGIRHEDYAPSAHLLPLIPDT